MKIGVVFGTFDLLHAGHMHLLEQARKHCDFLLVGLHVNPHVERVGKNEPVESIVERYIKLYGCKYVDGVICYEIESDIPLILKYFKVDVRFLGSDYSDTKKPITEKDAVPIIYLDSLPIHTSDIRKRI